MLPRELSMLSVCQRCMSQVSSAAHLCLVLYGAFQVGMHNSCQNPIGLLSDANILQTIPAANGHLPLIMYIKGC